MRIAFFEVEGWEEPLARASFPNAELSFFKEKVDELTPPPANEFEIVSVFVNSHLAPAVLAQFPKLKFITTRSTGFDHIDIAECARRGIGVAYVPGYGDNTVAEFAFGLILNLTRKMYRAIDQIKEMESFDLRELRGMDLKYKTIGIIGTGRIGKEMVKIAKGFGMNVVAYDPFPNEAYAKEMGYRYVPLEELLKSSDIITIHTPYTKETHHLLNHENIKLVKRGAYLINTARGGIVETDALVGALTDGTLAGAGVDVLEEEGPTKDEMQFFKSGRAHAEELRTIYENHMLMRMPNVLVTPHNAFNTQEALERIFRTTTDNIKGYIDGKPVNLVPQQ
jgi:D-lactate dehydrogenase